MAETIRTLSLIIVLAPLLGAILAGLFGKVLGRKTSHRVTVLLMFVAFFAACWVWKLTVLDHGYLNSVLYIWGESGNFTFNIGFMIDQLTAWMMLLVTFVSLLVHIYSIGYMADDSGYQRFFSYVSLFTFSMLLLVTANNFLQLFIGWEGVGLVSYLLIGFWYTKEAAIFGSFKAFIVNRVGDFGFIIGIAAVMTYFGTLDYTTVFAKAPALAKAGTVLAVIPGAPWAVLTFICLALFIGAMGKSAQMPLHVWLPESMEGPTPISALIHAATMVTAGVFMVARLSPMFELSPTALSVVLVIGATGALFTGLVAFVQHDIKRVIAYSTLSQLGYMMAAMGVSAYAAGIFHLMMHGCFKALLFLAAGSVILGMHHEQDMRKMGGLRKYMPITYITFLIGALALSAIPPFAGYYSKDAIIEAVGAASNIPGSGYAYVCLVLGAFVTAFYIFRAFFLTFHGKERFSAEVKQHVKESPWVVWLPLVGLAIPSVFAGAILAYPLLYASPSWFGKSIFVAKGNNVLATLAEHYHGWFAYALHSVTTAPFWAAVIGIVSAWVLCLLVPSWRDVLVKRLSWIYFILVKKYGFDDFNQVVIAHGSKRFGEFCYRVADAKILDDWIINGSGRAVRFGASVVRRLQTGYLYHYVFVMILGLVVFVGWFELFETHSVLAEMLKSKYF